MCFIRNCKNQLVAENDIEVYKVFRKVSYFSMHTYHTYYTGPYRSDYVYDDLNGEYYCDDFGREVESGWVGFHTFKNYNNAVAFMDSSNNWASENETYEIIPCIIPKGTKYFEGSFICMDAYVSERIRLNY